MLSRESIVKVRTKNKNNSKKPRGAILRSKVEGLAQELMSKAASKEPISTAVIHPVDEVSLLGAIESMQAGLIKPILIGPEKKIHRASEEIEIDITSVEIISTPHSHAAAEQGVALAGQGKVQALMKGAIHTDELMHAVLAKDSGIATNHLMSHIFVLRIPHYPKKLLISDAAINIYPDLEDKQDIVQNAINLAHALDIRLPKVAILSAVETVTSKIKATIDAAALCKMADRGQIKGAVLDGPLAFDNAISKEAAQIKHITSPVSGNADILICPDLEAANILVKQLEYFSDAQIAGIVLGAKVPIILTSRSDKMLARLASSALASIVVHKKLKS